MKYGDPKGKIVGRWSKAYGPHGNYKTGNFRQIYPINIMSREHLENEIDGLKLEEWVTADARRGEIVKLEGIDRWSWHVKFDNIEYVSESLHHTGIVLCM